MGKQIVILGGGFGGLATAHELRKGLSYEHKIMLVDRQPLFFMGLTKLWVLDGRRQVGDGPGNRILLSQRGVDFVEGEIGSIDVEGRFVQVGKQKIGFDYLVIALGADYSPSATPGFSHHAKNLYTESGCAEIRDELRSIDSGGITVLVCGLPFKCPPAPYEAAFIIEHLLKTRGVRERVSMQIVTPEPHPLTILGSEAGRVVTNLLSERGIGYHPSQRVKEIRAGTLLTESGKQFTQTLTFAIPTHVAPSVLRKAGLLNESGWIPVDPKTLSTRHTSVFAIGDCAAAKTSKGQLLPRAGILAEEEGKVVAANLTHEITSHGSRQEFRGEGMCFMETGDGKAAPVRANFYAEPTPKWEFTTQSVEGLREKYQFVEDRMRAWFT